MRGIKAGREEEKRDRPLSTARPRRRMAGATDPLTRRRTDG